MPNRIRNSGARSKPPKPLGQECRVGRLSQTHSRSGFDCGSLELNAPLVEYRIDGPRNDRELIVATLGESNRVLGYAALELSDLTLADGIEGQSYYIPWLAVDEEFHRRGIGTRLVSETLLLAKDWSKRCGIGPVTLHAETKIHGFYKQFGFEGIGNKLLAIPANVLSEL